MRRTVGLLPLLAVALPRPTMAHTGHLAISFPRLPLDPDSYVVYYRIDLKAALFDHTTVPLGWSVVINNDANFHTFLQAQCVVGATGAIPAAQFLKMKFPIIRRDIDGLTFDVSVRVNVTKDFMTTRTVAGSKSVMRMF